MPHGNIQLQIAPQPIQGIHGQPAMAVKEFAERAFVDAGLLRDAIAR